MQTDMITIDLQVPYFSGFYYGIWDKGNNEWTEINQMKDSGLDFESLCFPDDWGFDEDYCDNVANLFATEYVNLIAENIYHNVKLVKSYIISPREYNFTTDRIFAQIEIDDFDKFIKSVMSLASNPEYRTKLGKIIKENHTSCSGFISFMSNDIEDWSGLLIDPNNEEYIWCMVGYLIDLMNPHLNLNEMVYEYVASNTDWHQVIPLTDKAKEEWDIYLKYGSLYIDWVKEHPRVFPDPYRPNWKKEIEWDHYKERFMEVAEEYERHQKEIEILKSMPVIPGLD